MKKIKLNPKIDVNGLSFGSSREQVRKEFGKKYTEMKKSFLSPNTMDVYDDYCIFYSEDNLFEAIEITGEITVVINECAIFPNTAEAIMEILSTAKRKGDTITSKELSVEILLSEDGEAEAILLAKEGYLK